MRTRSLRLAACWLGLVGASSCASPLDQAETARAAGQTDAAIGHYRRALTRAETADASREALVELLYDEGKQQARGDDAASREAAARRFEEVLELAPAHGGALVALARVRIAQEAFPRALVLLDRAAQAGPCPACARLRGVALLRLGHQKLATGDIAAAERDFTEALEVLPDASAAIALVEAHVAAKRYELVFDALRRAHGLVPEADRQGRARLFRLRHDAAVQVAAGGAAQLELVQRLLELDLGEEPVQNQGALERDVALALERGGALDEAIARLGLLWSRTRAAEGDTTGAAPSFEAAFVATVQSDLARLLGARALRTLESAVTPAALTDLEAALKLAPSRHDLHWIRIVVKAAIGDLEGATAALEASPRTRGHAEVQAIVLALRATVLMGRGDKKGAASALASALEAGPERPEVHTAAARLLSETPMSGLSRASRRALDESGFVRYPKGQVLRYGEALAEIELARRLAARAKAADPLAGWWLEAPLVSLEGDLKKRFPFKVTREEGPTTSLVLRNSGTDRVPAVLEVRGKPAVDLSLPPLGSQRVAVSGPEVAVVVIAGRRLAFVPEPHTSLELRIDPVR